MDDETNVGETPGISYQTTRKLMEPEAGDGGTEVSGRGGRAG